MLRDISYTIVKHTVISRRHLTPEIKLRLITPASPLWTAKEEEIPFKDPFWAFYWPGGQATASVLGTFPTGKDLGLIEYLAFMPRTIMLWIELPAKDFPLRYDMGFFKKKIMYILDNGKLVADRNVLDIGCGCGAGAIVAAKMGANRILANDIDLYAVTATQINAELNNITLETNTKNLIGTDCKEFDTILIGDMFYNEEFASVLFKWLLQLRGNGKTVLLGDPGRHGLTEKRRRHIELLANYKLPPQSCIENHGFNETSLWRIK